MRDTNIFPGAAGPELRRDSLTRAVYEEAVGGGQVKLTVHRAEQLEKKDLGGKVVFTFTILSCLYSAMFHGVIHPTSRATRMWWCGASSRS